MSFKEGVLYALESSLASGADSVSVAVVMVCRLSDLSFVARSRVLGTHLVVRLSTGPAPATGLVSLFQFSLVRDNDVVNLLQEPDSTWAAHVEPEAHHWTLLKETCCGIGALGAGAHLAGMQVVAMNELQPVTCQLLRLLDRPGVVEGDIADQGVIRHMWDLDRRPTVLAAGVACQPYSLLGDRRGGRDPRSLSLPHVLQAGILLQSCAIVIECVQPAAQDEFVRTCLRAFCDATGFLCQEVLLDLSHVWAAHRARWWCVLTPPGLGPCKMRPWPQCDSCLTVESVLQRTLPVTPDLVDMELTQYEMRVFAEHKPISSYLLQASAPLPTTLHSCACQVYPCPCGCRKQPFTQDRLDQGIFAVLTPCHGSGYEGSEKLRHLAPAELALLNGLSPLGPWGPSPRLAACLIGQLASPLQSAWVFAHLRGVVHAQFPASAAPPHPMQLLSEARMQLLADAVTAGLRTDRATGDGNPPAVVPRLSEAPSVPRTAASTFLSQVVDLTDNPSLPKTSAEGESNTSPKPALPTVTASEAFPPPTPCDASRAQTSGFAACHSATAEARPLRPAPYTVSQGGTRMKEVIVDAPGTTLDVVGRACSSQYFSWQMRTRSDEYLPPDQVVQVGEVIRFTHVASNEGISLPLTFRMPLPSAVDPLLAPCITCAQRAQLLHLQHGRLADDQMHYLLKDLPAISRCPLVVVHPAHLLSAFQHQVHDVLEDHLQAIRLLREFGVVSALSIAGHWIVFAWMCNGDSVAAWSSYAPRHADDGIGVMNCVMGKALHRTLSQFRFLDGPIRPLNGPHCGRFALADVRSLLLSTPYLPDQDVLAQVRREVVGQLPPSHNGLVPLPLFLASGQELLEAGLASLLRDRGVPEAQSRSRAVAAIQALGSAKIQQAMQGKSPWKELKALANQAVPLFQFVLPSELEVAVKAKAGDGRPIASKRKQRQPPPFAVSTSRKQHALLPALDMIHVAPGVFTSAVGDLEHLEQSQVGPHAKGVFLLSPEAALPYTQVHKPVSSSALGLLVLGHAEVEGAAQPFPSFHG